MSIEHPNHQQYPDTILMRKFSGTVSVEEIMDSWISLHEQKRFTPGIRGVLNDLNDCELSMSIEGFNRLMSYMAQQEHLRNLNIAVVSNSPKNIIFPALGELQQKGLKIKPFSTFEAAVAWILG